MSAVAAPALSTNAVPQALGSVVEIPDKAGWIWKRSVGKSFFGRKNWKCRYLLSTIEGLTYYATEPFDDPKGFVSWSSVTHIYPIINSAIDADANDPEKQYFGFRFNLSPGQEKLFLMRVDAPQERDEWVIHLNAMFHESQKLLAMVDEDEEGVCPTKRAERRTQAKKGGGLIEVVTNKIRSMVSLKKQRFQRDGYDLDLAYIGPNLVAMGYPSEGSEAVYRNPMVEVVNFFDKYHKGKFRVYNLCSERSYPPNRFDGQFERFPFDDHNPPPLALILPMCISMDRHIKKDPEGQNVCAVHCKAGKGRTGAAICCYLIYSKQCSSAEAALEEFGRKRTMDGKGVQIPSQKRYIKYFEEMLTIYGGVEPPPSTIVLTKIVLSVTPKFDPDDGCDPFVTVWKRKPDHRHVPLGTTEGSVKNPMEMTFDSRHSSAPKHVIGIENYAINLVATLSGEIRITLYDQDAMSKDDVMCSFWLHTGFLPRSGQLRLKKNELDEAVKDKNHELFPEDFYLTLHYNFA